MAYFTYPPALGDIVTLSTGTSWIYNGTAWDRLAADQVLFGGYSVHPYDTFVTVVPFEPIVQTYT